MALARSLRLPAVLAAPLAALLLALLLVGPAAPAAADSGRAELSGRVLVTLDTAFTPPGRLMATDRRSQRDRLAGVRAGLLDRLAGTGARPVRGYDQLPYLAVEASAEAVRALRADPAVAAVRPDRRFTAALADSVPLVGAPQAWAAGGDGDGQVVAVLDSGVQADHPFLAGRVIAEACFSSGGDCPDGSSKQLGAGAAAPCGYDTRTCAHGTHVAGIVASADGRLAGVAPAARLAAVQVFSRSTVDCPAGAASCAISSTSDLLAGLDYVADLAGRYPIAAVNLSLGGGSFAGSCDADEPELARAVEALHSLGILTVAAAGNDGELQAMSAPGCLSAVVAVGSTSKTDAVSSFSNSSPQLALLAPGEEITSSWAENRTAPASGTSQATPHVAGAVAALKSAVPSASADEVLAALTSTGLPVTDPRNGRTTPRLQVDAALDALFDGRPRTEPAAAPTSARLSGVDRYATAARVFADSFGCDRGGAASAVLARGDAFADALTGSYLAGSRDTGVLLTAGDSVPDATLAALRASGAGTVYLLGGPAAIGAAVADRLARTPSVSCAGATGPPLAVVRISGDDRYATALAVADYVGPDGVGTLDSAGSGAAVRTAVLASGAGYADALAAGPLCYAGAGSAQAGNQLGFPLLLTGGSTLEDDVEAGLGRLGIEQVLLPAGTAVLSPQVQSRLEQLGITVVRIAGADRTETAAELARFAVGDRPGHRVGVGFDRAGVGLARGDAFADALAGAAHAGAHRWPLLLTVNPLELGRASTDYLRSAAGQTTTVTAYGGQSAVATRTLDDALAALSS